MKTPYSDKKESGVINIPLRWILIGIAVAIFIIVILMGIGVHAAASNAYQFNITTTGSNNQYFVTASVVPSLPANYSAYLVVTTNGQVILNHSFNSTYTTSLYLYSNSYAYIYFQGSTVFYKPLIVVSTPSSSGNGGIFGLEEILMLIGLMMLILFINDYVMYRFVSNKGKDPGVFNADDYGSVTKDARILADAEVTTQSESDSLVQLYNYSRKRGFYVPFDEILKENQVKFLNEVRDAAKRAKEGDKK